MSGTLQSYITQVQYLLHDTNANFWSISELTGYINEARNRICRDTKCMRQLATSIPLTAGVELYNVQSTLALATPIVSNSVIDVMGISLYWGNSRYKMNYTSFTELDAQARAWQLYQDRPVMFTRMGGLNIYVAPIPDQNYVTDWDVAIDPPQLVNLTDVDTVPAPFGEPVKFWAAYLAKFKEQALGECKIFRDEYARNGMMAARSFMTRTIRNPYQR